MFLFLCLINFEKAFDKTEMWISVPTTYTQFIRKCHQCNKIRESEKGIPNLISIRLNKSESISNTHTNEIKRWSGLARSAFGKLAYIQRYNSYWRPKPKRPLMLLQKRYEKVHTYCVRLIDKNRNDGIRKLRK